VSGYQLFLTTSLVCGAGGLIYAVASLISLQQELDEAEAPPRQTLLSYQFCAIWLLAAVVCVTLTAMARMRRGLLHADAPFSAGLAAGAAAALALAVVDQLFEVVTARRAECTEGALGKTRERRLMTLSLARQGALLSVVCLGLLLAGLAPEGGARMCAIGFAMSTVIQSALFALVPRALGRDRYPHDHRVVDLYALVAVAGALAICLADLRYKGSDAEAWTLLPSSLVGLGAIGLVIVTPFAGLRATSERPERGLLLALAGQAVCTGCVVLIASRASLEATSLGHAVGVGLLLAAGLLWVGRTARVARHAGREPNLLLAGGLMVLLVLAAAGLFPVLAGAFGVSVALVVAASLSVPSMLMPRAPEAEDEGTETACALALTAGLLFLLYRVFLELNRGVDVGAVSTHYSFLGLAAGGMLPILLMAYQRATHAQVGGRPRAPRAPLWQWALAVSRGLLIGAVAAGLPVVLLAAWGPESLVGLIVGGIVGLSAAVMVVLSAPRQSPATRGVVPLVLGAALSAAYVPGRYGELGELTRSGRAWVVAIAGLVIVAWFVVDGVLSGRTGSLADDRKEDTQCDTPAR